MEPRHHGLSQTVAARPPPITLDAADGELTVEWANPEDGATPESEAPREIVGVGG